MRVCQCDTLVEQYEEVIEDWYKGSQEEDLTTYLCEKHVLKGQDAGNTHTHKYPFIETLLMELSFLAAFYYGVTEVEIPKSKLFKLKCISLFMVFLDIVTKQSCCVQIHLLSV